MNGSVDPYYDWPDSPPRTIVIELPRAQLDRLNTRAVAAGCVGDGGQPELVELVMHHCRLHTGRNCLAGFDAIAANDTDPDLRDLLFAYSRAAKERERPN